MHLTICSYHVTYAIQSEATLYSCLNPHSIVATLYSCQVTKECGFTLKRVRDMIRTCSQMHYTDKYSQHSSIIWPVWLNGWVFVYKLNGCGFRSRCSHLNFTFRTCLEQGFPWHSDNYRVWIHSEIRMWHDKNIQSNAPYR